MYKCVCQQHSEQMYSDLIKKITDHLERVSKELQVKDGCVMLASLGLLTSWNYQVLTESSNLEIDCAFKGLTNCGDV